MKLTVCSPGFVDARNAILLADQNLTGGANQCLIWRGFATRGLGQDAKQGSAFNYVDGTESFTVPASACGPVAAADSYAVEEDTALSVPAPGVLGDDADPDGDPLTVSPGLRARAWHAHHGRRPLVHLHP